MSNEQKEKAKNETALATTITKELAVTDMIAAEELEGLQSVAEEFSTKRTTQQIESLGDLLPFYKPQYKDDLANGLVRGKITNTQMNQFDSIYFITGFFYKHQANTKYNEKEKQYHTYCFAPATKEYTPEGVLKLSPVSGELMEKPAGNLCANCGKTKWGNKDGQRIKPDCNEVMNLVGYHLIDFENILANWKKMLAEKKDTAGMTISKDCVQPFQTSFRATALSAFRKYIGALKVQSVKNSFALPLPNGKELTIDGKFLTVVKLSYTPYENYFKPEFKIINLENEIDDPNFKKAMVKLATDIMKTLKNVEKIFFDKQQRAENMDDGTHVSNDDDAVEIVE